MPSIGATSTTCTSRLRALDVGEELVAEPRALGGALDQARDVGDHELAALVVLDRADRGLERRERIVGDLGLGAREAAAAATTCRRWAGPRARRRRAASGAARSSPPRPAGRARRSAAPGGWRSRTACCPTRPRRRGPAPRAGPGAARSWRTPRARSSTTVPTGTLQDELVAAGAVALLALTVPAPRCLEVALVAVGREVAQARVRDHDDVGRRGRRRHRRARRAARAPRGGSSCSRCRRPPPRRGSSPGHTA